MWSLHIHSTKPVLSYFAIASIGLLVMTGQLADIPLTLDTPYYAGIAVAAAHLAQQVCTLNSKQYKYYSHVDHYLIELAAFIRTIGLQISMQHYKYTHTSNVHCMLM
jgi:hypothetical protein